MLDELCRRQWVYTAKRWAWLNEYLDKHHLHVYQEKPNAKVKGQ